MEILRFFYFAIYLEGVVDHMTARAKSQEFPKI